LSLIPHPFSFRDDFVSLFADPSTLKAILVNTFSLSSGDVFIPLDVNVVPLKVLFIHLEDVLPFFWTSPLALTFFRFLFF